MKFAITEMMLVLPKLMKPEMTVKLRWPPYISTSKPARENSRTACTSSSSQFTRKCWAISANNVCCECLPIFQSYNKTSLSLGLRILCNPLNSMFHQLSSDCTETPSIVHCEVHCCESVDNDSHRLAVHPLNCPVLKISTSNSKSHKWALEWRNVNEQGSLPPCWVGTLHVNCGFLDVSLDHSSFCFFFIETLSLVHGSFMYIRRGDELFPRFMQRRPIWNKLNKVHHEFTSQTHLSP